MPIYRLLQNSGLDPTEMQGLSDAFEAVCRELRLAEKDDRLRDFVATKVLELAARGERDPDRICVLALADLRGTGPTTETQKDALPEP
jgi:hypothetical protein